MTGYTAKVDAINAAQFESDELIELAWQLGREARELGIEEQPPLRSWEDVGLGSLWQPGSPLPRDEDGRPARPRAGLFLCHGEFSSRPATDGFKLSVN